jgi:hypothetical protein
MLDCFNVLDLCCIIPDRLNLVKCELKSLLKVLLKAKIVLSHFKHFKVLRNQGLHMNWVNILLEHSGVFDCLLNIFNLSEFNQQNVIECLEIQLHVCITHFVI